MKTLFLVLALVVSPVALARMANETSMRHQIVISHPDGSESRHDIERLTENGKEAGLYAITKHKGRIVEELRYDPELKWSNTTPTEKEIFRANAMVFEMMQDHPHRFLAGIFTGKEGSDALLGFLEAASNSYELIYKQNPRYYRMQKRVLHTDKYLRNRNTLGLKDNQGTYLEREYYVPIENVVIRNKDTKESQNLEDFVEYLVAEKRQNDSYYIDSMKQSVGSLNKKRQMGKKVAGVDHWLVAPKKEMVAKKPVNKAPGRSPASFGKPLFVPSSDTGENPYAEWQTKPLEVPKAWDSFRR